jgi:thymidylate synthase (FAD)
MDNKGPARIARAEGYSDLILIEPRVIKLAETRVDRKAVDSLLKELGSGAQEWWAQKGEAWKSDSELLIEIAGRTCYESFGTGLNPNITKVRTDSEDYFKNVLEKGDGSIFEHSTVTFALLWVSRVFTHELIRHRVGTAYSQESLRYVRIKEIKMPAWNASVPAESLSADMVRKMSDAIKDLESRYNEIVKGVNWDTLAFDQKKRVTSALRRMLPQGISTSIIFTANHRTLRWLIEMRTDPGAEYEIRKVFGQIAEICLRDYAMIYKDFKKTRLEDGTFQYKPTLRSKV